MNYTIKVRPGGLPLNGPIVTESLYIEQPNHSGDDIYTRLTGSYDSSQDPLIIPEYNGLAMQPFDDFDTVDDIKSFVVKSNNPTLEPNYLGSFEQNYNIFANGYGAKSLWSNAKTRFYLNVI